MNIYSCWFRLLFSLFLYSQNIRLVVPTDTQCPTVYAIEDRRTHSTLRYVQYNAEWLFIDEYASAKCPGTGCPWANETEAQTHLSHVATVLQELNPDIVNLCEVEGCDELNALLQSFSPSLAKEYCPYLIQGTDTSTGQNVGMITKIDPLLSLYRTEERVSYPIPESTCNYTGTPSTTGVSKHYITEMNINQIRIAIVGTHMLAYPTDVQRCAQREAQAQVIQNVIIAFLSKGYEIILAGDLNDYDAEIADMNGNMPISSTLDILKGYAGKYKNKYVLFSVAEWMEQNMRYSDWWDKNGNCQSTLSEFSMIDHILVTEYLYESITNAFVYHNYTMNCNTYESDHYPVVVDFLI